MLDVQAVKTATIHVRLTQIVPWNLSHFTLPAPRMSCWQGKQAQVPDHSLIHLTELVGGPRKGPLGPWRTPELVL